MVPDCEPKWGPISRWGHWERLCFGKGEYGRASGWPWEVGRKQLTLQACSWDLPEFGLLWQSLFCGDLKDVLISLIWLVVEHHEQSHTHIHTRARMHVHGLQQYSLDTQKVSCVNMRMPPCTPTGTIVLVSVQNTTSRNEQGGSVL